MDKAKRAEALSRARKISDLEPSGFVKEARRLYGKTSESPWVKDCDMCNAVWIEYGPKGLRLAYPLDDSRVQFSRSADVDFIVWVHENILPFCNYIEQLKVENKRYREALEKFRKGEAHVISCGECGKQYYTLELFDCPFCEEQALKGK